MNIVYDDTEKKFYSYAIYDDILYKKLHKVHLTKPFNQIHTIYMESKNLWKTISTYAYNWEYGCAINNEFHYQEETNLHIPIHFRLDRSETINKSPQQVYSLIKSRLPPSLNLPPSIMNLPIDLHEANLQ